MGKQAYIQTQPKKVELALRYADESGDKISVEFNSALKDIYIKQEKDTIAVSVDDIDWLKNALEDIKFFATMNVVK